MPKKLLILSIMGFIIVCLYEKIDNKIHQIEIDNIFINDITSNNHDYIGYIEIERLNIKREIVLGINDFNLKKHVTLEQNSSLDSNHIVLAGHSIKNIFGNLHKAKIKDKIKLHSFNNTYIYEIISKEIVPKENVEIIKTGELVLITCTYDDRRLIIKAKRI